MNCVKPMKAFNRQLKNVLWCQWGIPVEEIGMSYKRGKVRERIKVVKAEDVKKSEEEVNKTQLKHQHNYRAWKVIVQHYTIENIIVSHIISLCKHAWTIRTISVIEREREITVIPIWWMSILYLVEECTAISRRSYSCVFQKDKVEEWPKRECKRQRRWRNDQGKWKTVKTKRRTESCRRSNSSRHCKTESNCTMSSSSWCNYWIEAKELAWLLTFEDLKGLRQQ